MDMPMSDAGLAELKHYEGCRCEAYKCEAGVWTIGYGDTIGVTMGMRITQSEADMRLKARLREFEAGVDAAITRSMTQGQLDAFVCLAYNIGVAAFRSSTMVDYFNAGDIAGAGREFGRWIHVRKIISPNLVKRRFSELVRYFQ